MTRSSQGEGSREGFPGAACTKAPGPQWTQTDRDSFANRQRKLGYRGADADGLPGPASWKALRVPSAA